MRLRRGTMAMLYIVHVATNARCLPLIVMMIVRTHVCRDRPRRRHPMAPGQGTEFSCCVFEQRCQPCMRARLSSAAAVHAGVAPLFASRRVNTRASHKIRSVVATPATGSTHAQDPRVRPRLSGDKDVNNFSRQLHVTVARTCIPAGARCDCHYTLESGCMYTYAGISCDMGRGASSRTLRWCGCR